MPDLKTALQNHDPAYLLTLAEMWGFELNEPGRLNPLPTLLAGFNNRDLVKEVIESLPSQAREAINNLIQNGGKLPWVQFCRQYGELRIMGPGKREREKPNMKPANSTEWLWYRGIIYKAFFKTGLELQECAYLPDEFIEILQPNVKHMKGTIFGKPVDQKAIYDLHLATDHILDDCCTLLVAMRNGFDIDSCCQFETPKNVLIELLRTAEIITTYNQPNAQKTRAFMEAPRGQALAILANVWLNSVQFNELSLIPELGCEGKWKNNALETRQAIIALVKLIPINQWWDLQSFIDDLHTMKPEFQRPSGDYDSWFIRDQATGEYLHGFANWEKVEGRLIHFLIKVILHGLGYVDLAKRDVAEQMTVFRITPWADYLWEGKSPANIPEEKERISIQSNGKIFVPRLAPRVARYQIARFCDWDDQKEDTYYYHVSAPALKRAEAQKLHIDQFISLIKKYGKLPIPPSILQSFDHWEKHKLQARLDKSIFLRVTDPTILDNLEKSRAKRFILERTTPCLMLIKPGGVNAIQQVLTELGYLAEISSSL